MLYIYDKYTGRHQTSGFQSNLWWFTAHLNSINTPAVITDYYWIYFQFKLISTYGPFKTQDILVFAQAKNTMSILMAFHLIKKKKHLFWIESHSFSWDRAS